LVDIIMEFTGDAGAFSFLGPDQPTAQFPNRPFGAISLGDVAMNDDGGARGFVQG
jgi:hypothetical protein